VGVEPDARSVGWASRNGGEGSGHSREGSRNGAATAARVSEAKPSPAAHVNCISNSQAWNPTRAQILVADHNIEASPGTPPFVLFYTVKPVVLDRPQEPMGVVMSMEMYVLSDKGLGSIADWQRAIEAEGFGLRLDTEREFDALGGHLPAHLGEQHAGFECDHWDAGELMDEDPSVDYGRRWKHALAFRWGGDLYACLGASIAATAYARATDGVVLDCEENRILTPPEALEITRLIEQDVRNAPTP
jgi:hypothetical protein